MKMSTPVIVPAVTSISSMPDNVPPGEGFAYTAETSNLSALATPKLDAIAHNTPANALLHFDFMIVPQNTRFYTTTLSMWQKSAGQVEGRRRASWGGLSAGAATSGAGHHPLRGGREGRRRRWDPEPLLLQQMKRQALCGK